jgi:hypothetical protein
LFHRQSGVRGARYESTAQCDAMRPTGRNVFQCQCTDFSSVFVVWNGHNCDQSTCMTAYRQLDTEPKTTVQLSTSKPENAIIYVKEVRWQSCNPSMCDSKQVIILFERCVEHRFRTVSFINSDTNVVPCDMKTIRYRTRIEQPKRVSLCVTVPHIPAAQEKVGGQHPSIFRPAPVRG